MKNLFDNRLFCLGMSMACSWFMYQDYSEHNKINILNLIYFLGFAFLTVYKKKVLDNTTCEKNNQIISKDKKNIISEFNEEQELQLSNTFKNQYSNK